MIVVAGNPRSGTSLQMLCFHEAVGKDRILGDKFPQEKRFESVSKKQENESDEQYAIRKYTFDKYPKNSPEAIEKFKDMNPNGFWECPYTVQGIKYQPATKDLFEKVKHEDKNKPYIIKLVNSGLIQSNPENINKVIYMLRHPRSIAKSQERLEREKIFVLPDGREVDLYEGNIVHDPEFFIRSTCDFAKWKLSNPDVPVLFVKFDDLISDPKKELKRIAEFTDIPELENSHKLINPKLKRSEPDLTKPSDLWEQSEKIYDCMLKEDYEGVLKIAEDKHDVYFKRQYGFTCLRLRAHVSYANCLFCRKLMDEEFIKSGIKRAEVNEWDWENEPCAFECGYDVESDLPLTIEESIENNHWKDYK